MPSDSTCPLRPNLHANAERSVESVPVLVTVLLLPVSHRSAALTVARTGPSQWRVRIRCAQPEGANASAPMQRNASTERTREGITAYSGILLRHRRRGGALAMAGQGVGRCRPTTPGYNSEFIARSEADCDGVAWRSMGAPCTPSRACSSRVSRSDAAQRDADAGRRETRDTAGRRRVLLFRLCACHRQRSPAECVITDQSFARASPA
ncbi:hypothetical protein GY45DRAFT_978488 [Cubamyces sp. BRFM 1775]|nr:hypothetical protein GY45DRAFT_978488 [Cubamyces sp. BRFM 1775]